MKTVRELIAELQQEDQDAPVISFYWLPTDYYFDEFEASPKPTADEFRQVDVFRGAIDYATDELGQAINDEVYEAMRKARS